MNKSLIIAGIVSASMLALSGCETTGSEKSAEAAPASPAMSSEQASYDAAAKVLASRSKRRPIQTLFMFYLEI